MRVVTALSSFKGPTVYSNFKKKIPDLEGAEPNQENTFQIIFICATDVYSSHLMNFGTYSSIHLSMLPVVVFGTGTVYEYAACLEY